MLLLRPMAKKTPGRKPHASELRRGNPTPSELREAAAILESYAGRLTDLAAAIEEAGLKSVPIDGDKKFANGTAKIEQYVKAVHKGLIEAQ